MEIVYDLSSRLCCQFGTNLCNVKWNNNQHYHLNWHRIYISSKPIDVNNEMLSEYLRRTICFVNTNMNKIPSLGECFVLWMHWKITHEMIFSSNKLFTLGIMLPKWMRSVMRTDTRSNGGKNIFNSRSCLTFHTRKHAHTCCQLNCLNISLPGILSAYISKLFVIITSKYQTIIIHEIGLTGWKNSNDLINPSLKMLSQNPLETDPFPKIKNHNHKFICDTPKTVTLLLLLLFFLFSVLVAVIVVIVVVTFGVHEFERRPTTYMCCSHMFYHLQNSHIIARSTGGE